MLSSLRTRFRTVFTTLLATLYPWSSALAGPCSGSNISITGISSSVFYVDLSPPAGATPITGGYIGYSIVNNGSAIDDLWVKVENVSGGNLDLAPYENGVSHVGYLAGSGATQTVYFFFTSNSDNATGQTHDIAIYPSKPGSIAATCSDTFTYTTDHSQQASANKVVNNGVTVSPNPPELGRDVVVTISGFTGTISNDGHFRYSPASYPTWRSDAYELQKVDMDLGGTPYPDVNYVNVPSLSNTAYTQTYRFKVKSGTGGANTSVSPMSHIHSGGMMKHTDTGNFATLLPLSAPVSKVTVTSVVTTQSATNSCFAGGIGGASTVEVVVTNSGLGPISLDDIEVNLPAGVTFDSSVTPTFDGTSINNPTIVGNTLSWYYPFTVPAAASASSPTSRSLTFSVNVQPVNGVYNITSVGHIDTTQIDSTESITDNVPTSGYTCVGALPTATPTVTPTPTTAPSDIDQDNDGIPDSTEGTTDKDGDGIPNHLDLDSDNDGILDIIEGGGTDSDGDGRADSTTDSDGDGLVDQYDSDSGGTSQPTQDTDNDGTPDYLDIDSDGDGISDRIEGRDPFVPPINVDSDGDGIDNAYDKDSGGATSSPTDTDGDITPDYRDLDSDGDGSADYHEAYDTNGDGIADVKPLGVDSNNNGIDDAFEAYSTPSNFDDSWRKATSCRLVDLSRKKKKVVDARTAIHDRSKKFAARAKSCKETNSSRSVAKSGNLSKQLADLMTSCYDGKVYSCATGECQIISLKRRKAQMVSLARQLGATAKRIKLQAIKSCPAQPPTPGEQDNRPKSDDYTNSLVNAIKAMPDSVHRCNE
jgi:hypothetical protein